MVSHRQSVQKNSSSTRNRYRDDDEEAANGNGNDSADSPRKSSNGGHHSSLHDAAQLKIAESRRNELKKKILDGVGEFNLEQYRKSEDELKEIKNKKVKEFYEKQNDKLDDWAEVDGLVYALADDVLDSMNPDPDHDGYVDSQGPLLQNGGQLDHFLPQETRDKRAKDEKKAKWAINVCSAPPVRGFVN